ncbi:mechanosensitive ion channel family protein [Roseivirga pacifica]|uniref:mechanosensitive ion channel family protein n=1 Tax=Roseivirga pacifica TaxID=1267423 RepID=UPI002094C644|nr:mechanosensitive ion channel domain-containing protein [Roseivirga pacifica]MCO6358618.1 mechanosensitive ion channel [Roseivirga pacifica]MCO6365746.1 mechanosensitive ion channel [Roseivirga pacifica]MCO6371524.1 mechanosensitive ion channel [Roseivirga pacifica]MCO6376365.1 mechanosensitive ion channel [Roseivirga pacifica]MCO6378902.1 mechanosensitive ion channel [Roseivirga pacifica]
MEEIKKHWDQLSEVILEYGLQVLGAIAVLIIGRIIIKAIVSRFVKTLKKREVDPTIIPTLKGVANVALMAALIFAVIGIVGIPTSGFIAVFGAAGLAIGLALQGSLSNFAGGILILTLKPFKAGDFVEVNGQSGTVHAVTIINTVLRTVDNKIIYLANGAVAGANITNVTHEPKRRWDKVFGIGYEDDFEKAKKIIADMLDADPRVHKDPAPFVRVGNLGDSSVDITVRAWVDTAELWNLNFDMIEKVKKEFDAQGISIPFPQRDVHIYNEK